MRSFISLNNEMQTWLSTESIIILKLLTPHSSLLTDLKCPLSPARPVTAAFDRGEDRAAVMEIREKISCGRLKFHFGFDIIQPTADLSTAPFSLLRKKYAMRAY